MALKRIEKVALVLYFEDEPLTVSEIYKAAKYHRIQLTKSQIKNAIYSHRKYFVPIDAYYSSTSEFNAYVLTKYGYKIAKRARSRLRR